ncbi:MAG: DNA primase [Candidatus Dojkabacteria bacterium]
MTDIELVKSKLDIVEVISSYVPTVARAGSNYRALCPFHNEKSPSFMINPSLQIFKCFGCGKAGDAIKFIEEIERLEFPEALKVAAEKAGVELTGRSIKKDEKLEAEKKKLIEANELTAKFYHYILQSHKNGKPGRDYAQKRQIDGERIQKFLVGYAPIQQDALKKFLVSKGFNEKDLVRWGLLVERNGKNIDKFRNRLMQCIFNIRGDVVGFSGRYIGTSKEAPKYLNSPETLVYKKNEMLYGLFHAKEALRKDKFAIMVEGNIDILSSHRVGIENIVAPLGTAFTRNQATLLKRYVDEVYFSFDTDSAGTKALIRGMEILEEIGLRHKVIDLTGYQDADELICKNPAEWPERIKNARDTVEYLMIKLQEPFDMGSAEGKKAYSSVVLPIVASVKDSVSRNQYVKDLSLNLEVPPDTIISLLSHQKKPAIHHDSVVEVGDIVVEPLKKNELEDFFLSLLMQGDSIADVGVKSEWLESPLNQKIMELVLSNSSGDFSEMESKLSEQERKSFENILMIDVSGVKDRKGEMKKLTKRLKNDFLKREILRLRSELRKTLDKDNVISQIDVYVKELSKNK